jgi:hypothetical protein
MRLHIMEQVGNDRYNVVVHSDVPPGNNAANLAWQSCVVGAGLNVTQMTVGNNPGQIAQAEATKIANGQVIETAFQWDDNAQWNNQQRLDDLNARAAIAVAEAAANLQNRLKNFGRTVA